VLSLPAGVDSKSKPRGVKILRLNGNPLGFPQYETEALKVTIDLVGL
jgi:hypothetical protein